MSILEVGPLLLGCCWVVYSKLASGKIKLLSLIIIMDHLPLQCHFCHCHLITIAKYPWPVFIATLHHILAIVCNHVTELIVRFAVMMRPNKTETLFDSCSHYMWYKKWVGELESKLPTSSTIFACIPSACHFFLDFLPLVFFNYRILNNVAQCPSFSPTLTVLELPPPSPHSPSPPPSLSSPTREGW